MSMQKSLTPQNQETFRVGGRVAFTMGQRRLVGHIVEDRGGIATGGRHLFRVEVPLDFEPALVIELPADELIELPADELQEA